MNLKLDALRRYVGSRVREERQQKHWTLEELAGRAKTAPGYLGHIERGESTSSLKTLLRLADALGIPIASLLPELPKSSMRRRSRQEQLYTEIETLLKQVDRRKLSMIAKVIRGIVEE